MRFVRLFVRGAAKLLWDAFAAMARLRLLFVSADSTQRGNLRQLRNDFQQLPSLDATGAAEIRGTWESNRLRLRNHVLSRDPRAFLTWDVIRETMFPPPYAWFARAELKFLQREDWARWREALGETTVGLPFPCLWYPSSSSNAIHHAYHLCRFEVDTGARLRDFGTVLEFGGGYGSLCRIVHNLGFVGRYVIFDLPEQSALQRYYLASAGIQDVLTISDIGLLEGSFAKPKLFIATWSLSESPLRVREQVAEAVRSFDAFLIAYQSEFAGVDNRAFFDEWQRGFPHVDWRAGKMEHVPASTYLFGLRRA